MRVLYVDHKHDLSGGPKSLITTLEALEERNEVSPHVAVDPDSYLYDRLSGENVPLHPIKMNRDAFDPTEESNIHRNPQLLLKNVPIVAGALYGLANVVFKNDIDVIHCNSVKASLLSAIVSAITRTPFVHHARISQQNVDHGWLDQFVLFTADRFIANSKFTKRTFDGKWHSSIKVIYPPVSHSEFSPSGNNANLKEIIGTGKINKAVGMIARIEPRKRYEDFIKTAPIILETFPNTHFLLIGGKRTGEQQYFQALQTKVEKLKLTSNVHFLGKREDVPELMNALDVTVLPSRHEPFGKVALESILTETPVVASNEGGLREIVKPGSGGSLVPPESPGRLAEAIIHFLQDESNANNVAKRGRARIKNKFSLKNNIDQKIELYRQMVRR